MNDSRSGTSTPTPAGQATPEEMALAAYPNGPRRSKERERLRTAFARGVRAALAEPKKVDLSGCPECQGSGMVEDEGDDGYCNECDRQKQITCPACKGTGRPS